MPQLIDKREFIVGSLALAASASASLRAAAANTNGIFDSVETRKDTLKPFPKWRGALDKYFEERKDEPGSCTDLSFNRCHYAEWYGLLEQVRGQALAGQLKEINRYMNTHRYIVDPVNWGVLDYWEAPGEFFSRMGDCEDYAIAKFLSLRAIDAAVDDMRIVILNDLNLRVAHAVLAVYAEGAIKVLDNQLSIVVDASKIHHYQPIYSVNETGWWKHRPA